MSPSPVTATAVFRRGCVGAEGTLPALSALSRARSRTPLTSAPSGYRRGATGALVVLPPPWLPPGVGFVLQRLSGRLHPQKAGNPPGHSRRFSSFVASPALRRALPLASCSSPRAPLRHRALPSVFDYPPTVPGIALAGVVLLYCCCIAVLLLHCCCIAVALLLLCCCFAVALLLLCCCFAVALLLLCCMIVQVRGASAGLLRGRLLHR